ncbi:MAG TPA: DUF4340 domain-containing protein, partial [Gemmata sp.]|nr:DUF4340 domain-containing protein [Gemmata sp.]
RVGKDRWQEEWEVSSLGGGKQTLKAKADPGAIEEVIKALLKAKPTANSESNPALLGLQPPGLRVTLRQGSERSSTINFGNLTSGAKAVAFVTTSARPHRPLATPRASIDPLFRSTGGEAKAVDLVKWASDFRVKSIFGADARGARDDVDGLTLTAKGKTLSMEKVGGVWKFVQPAGWGNVDPMGDATSTPGTFTGAGPLLGAITSLQALAPADFLDNPSAEDLVKYGLNPGNPDIVKVEAKLKDNETATVLIGKKDSTPTAPGPGGMPGMPSGKVWLKVEGEPGVIRANSGDLSGLIPVIENPDPLRDRTLLVAEKSRIDGIDLTVAGQTTKLRRAGSIPEWKLFGNSPAGDPQLASRLVVDKLLDLLTERRTIKGFPAANPANFAPPEIKAEVKVWAAGFEPGTDDKAEPKEKGKPTTLLFGKKEGDSIYVRRTLPDGTIGEFLLPDRIKIGAGGETVELIPAITKTRLDFLDPNLKTFSTEVANKIAVSGIKNYELDKEEKKDPSANQDRWTFAAPADQKGKTADANTVLEMLRILGTTHSVTRFVDEAPSPAKLIEYGLASPATPPPMSPPSPRLKVVIGLKGTDAADKERVFEFGAITGDFVYARQTGKAAVFTLPKFVFDKFAEADLRDRAIFQFDPAMITAIELKGWGTAGFVTDLHFEKNKEGVWIVTKSPGQYTVDPKKIEAFLAVLNTTNVKAFLPGAPTAEQGFGDVKVSLIIVLKTAAGPLISLNLGASADGGASYYGWTSILPQTAPVFTVDAARFKVYKESSGVFAK